jgi:hypothetical protein
MFYATVCYRTAMSSRPVNAVIHGLSDRNDNSAFCNMGGVPNKCEADSRGGSVLTEAHLGFPS